MDRECDPNWPEPEEYAVDFDVMFFPESESYLILDDFTKC